jgi:hypothetical protein
MPHRIAWRSKVMLDLLVNIVHCIQKQRSLSSGVKTDRVHRDMPFSVPAMHPRYEPCPGLHPMISITYKKHLTLQVLLVRIVKQPWLEEAIFISPMFVPPLRVLRRNSSLFTRLVANGYIEDTCPCTIAMSKLRFQVLDIRGKCWSD